MIEENIDEDESPDQQQNVSPSFDPVTKNGILVIANLAQK